MIIAGICLCIGFSIGKKLMNEVEYHGYIQGEKLKEKLGVLRLPRFLQTEFRLKLFYKKRSYYLLL
jgi:hypothetical protein